MKEKGGDPVSELERVDAPLCKDMPLSKGSVVTGLSAYEEHKTQGFAAMDIDGPIVDGDI